MDDNHRSTDHDEHRSTDHDDRRVYVVDGVAYDLDQLVHHDIVIDDDDIPRLRALDDDLDWYDDVYDDTAAATPTDDD